MNLFLGIFPDEKSNYKIRKVVGDVGTIFDGFDMDVRWAKPENFHITLQNLGESNVLKEMVYRLKLRDIEIPQMNITLSDIKLGFTRTHKDLVYLSPSEGGEELRKLVYGLRKKLGLADSRNFVPHLTLGRVSKDLTNQEYRNISGVLKKTRIEDITFSASSIYLIREDESKYSLVKEYNNG